MLYSLLGMTLRPTAPLLFRIEVKLPRCLDIRWFGCHNPHDTLEPIRGAFSGSPPKVGHVVS